MRGFDSPTPGEAKYLQEQVTPGLAAAIQEHAAELHAEAVAGLKKTLAEQIARARTELDTLEKQAAVMIATA